MAILSISLTQRDGSPPIVWNQTIRLDEDFDSLQTGWQLALKIRNKRPSARIAMIVRSNPKQEHLPSYDVTVSLPISEDELGEINRS